MKTGSAIGEKSNRDGMKTYQNKDNIIINKSSNNNKDNNNSTNNEKYKGKDEGSNNSNESLVNLLLSPFAEQTSSLF
jgi:hypothetical protein